MHTQMWAGGFVLGLAVALGGGSAGAAPPAPEGRALYRTYCASCHGPAGRGDGPDASLFAVPPRDLGEGFLGKYSTDELVRRVQAGRPLALVRDPKALEVRLADVEGLYTYLRKLPTIDWRLVESGQRTYIARCEQCHGPDGRPGAAPSGGHTPPDLSDPAVQRALSDDALMIVIRRGHARMPAPASTSDREARATAAFVRLFSPGFTLYSGFCAGCHGDDGRGVGSFSEDVPRPTVIFDRRYFARHDPDDVRTAIWHMVSEEKPRMPHLRTLDTAQIRAIVEYLKQDLGADRGPKVGSPKVAEPR
jgi:mono/diheme cytochrome c family protein